LGRGAGGVCGVSGGAQKGSGANSVFVAASADVAVIAVAAALFKHNLMTAHYNR